MSIVTKEFLELQISETQASICQANLNIVKANADFNFHRGELAAYQKIMQFFEPVDKGFVSNN